MKIITLRGDSDKGKTTTLNIVYKTLLDNGGISKNKQKLGGDPNDFFDLVTYEGQKIYFFTMGDYSRCLVDAIRDSNSKGRDVFICACNSRFTNPFKEMMKYLHHIIEKTLAQGDLEQKIANQNDADIILQLI